MLKYVQKREGRMKMFIKNFIALLFLVFSLGASTFDIQKMRESFHNKVVKTSLDNRNEKFRLDESYWDEAQNYLWGQVEHFTSSQFITLVDLSKQVLILVLWDNEKKNFHHIGFDFVSTGDMSRESEVTNGDSHYLKTPIGLFDIKSGWRSDGKPLDDNVTLPYGKKDTFVFYFGEQDSIRYNTFDSDGGKITDPSKWQLITDKLQFAIHAHESATSLGEPNSHGCIRMSTELNLFLDNNSVFFKHLYNENKEWTHPYKKPPKEPKNHELAGEYMLIIDEL